MKKALAITLVLLVLVSAALLSACTGTAAPAASESAAAGETAAVQQSAAAAESNEAANGEKLKYVHVETVHGTNWWNAAVKGMQEQADYYGDMEVDMVGPVNRDSAEQIQLVQDLITKGVDMISIIPVDNTALDPVLQKARDAGIAVVVQEAATVQNCDANVEMQDDTGIGKEYIESLVAKNGDKGGYAVFVNSLTSSSHMTRAQSIIDYQEANYPDLYLVTDPIVDSDEQDITYQNVVDLLQTYDDLIGICLIGDSGNLAVAQALKDKGRTDVANIGMSMPSVVNSIVKEGLMEPYTNFSPYDNGKALVTVARWIATGNALEDLTEIPNAGETGTASVEVRDGKNVYVNARYTITKDNIDTFDF